MNARAFGWHALLLITSLLGTSAAPCIAGGVEIQTEGTKVKLTWPSAIVIPGQGAVSAEYTVGQSLDLTHWTPIGGKVRAVSGRSGPVLSLSLDRAPGAAFFRIVADPSSTNSQETGSGGADVFGYDSLFDQKLTQLGFMSIQEFGAATSQPEYLPSLSWDPTTAQFWTNYEANSSFLLNNTELAMFRTNGFVVCERLGAGSFAEIYDRVFRGDLPVFVTSDSILQAWHRTYISMLGEIEELELATLLERVITNMVAPLRGVWQHYGNGPLHDSILDADYFLTVERSLWAGEQVPSVLNLASQDQRVSSTLAAIRNLQLQKFDLFGTTNRLVDFSQFEVRGHYTTSERLSRYFQAMMWCGRIDLRLATFPPNQEDDIRQLGTAVVLNYLLNQSGQFNNWSAIEEITRTFVGPTDSMTFGQLGRLLATAGIQSPADVPDLLTLTNLQTQLLSGELGIQSITSDKFYSPLCPEELKLPRSFTVCGQKFILDSWAFSQVVFDKVHWPSDNCVPYCGATNVCTKVIRRKPSCLDIAFSVLGNDQAAPTIIERIACTNGEAFRDGLPYQHNLMAARRVIDGQDPSSWTNNIYTAWLDALRALSEPTTDPEYPEAMRTHAWAMKALNTQLASWTELRHDTVLYAKQSYTPGFICSYPYGFVEPLPAFWQRMKDLGDMAAKAISDLPLSGQVTVPGRTNFVGLPTAPVTFDLTTVKSNEVWFLGNFANTMSVLRGIAERELAQQPLDQEETDFLTSVLQNLGLCHSTDNGYSGWYPKLFYRDVFWDPSSAFPNSDMFDRLSGCAMNDAIVTDVHTDAPDELVCDPGAVVHEGIGNVNLLLIAVDNGPDRMVYAGPVLSHYEFELSGVNRMTDEQWKARVSSGQIPPSPEWTRGYLVPAH